MASQDVTKDYIMVYICCGAHVQMPISTADGTWHVVAPTYVCVVHVCTHMTSSLYTLHLCFVLSCAGEVSMGYSSGDDYGTTAVLVGISSAEDESVMKRSNTDSVAPALYEVPVQHKTQYEVVLKHTTSAEMNAAGHGCYEVPASENEYDMVLEHRTKNANALYGGVGFGSSSAASSLFYQYVPSKVSPF